jgi:high-affinity nickel permease
LTFAVVFWNISKVMSYEKSIKTYMIISGWGILIIFGADQAVVQTQLQSPYPPFGLATVPVLIIGAFLMLLGIYNSATLVSVNNNLRKSIRKYALESRLLDLIGQAEMEKEIRKTVNKITQDKGSLEMNTELSIELDEKELKKYVDFVIREVKKKDKR